MIKLLLILAAISCSSETTSNTANENTMQEKSIHDFKIRSLEGKDIDLKDFKGKKMLVVNTASECGYTPQYAELQELYANYGNKLVVIGFPTDDFGGQEPGSNVDIKAFCQKNYGVTFPMSEKITVKGNNISPVYKWLTLKANNGVLDAEIKWNFDKFLLDENGRIIQKFESGVSPLSEQITKHL